MKQIEGQWKIKNFTNGFNINVAIRTASSTLIKTNNKVSKRIVF